MSTELERLESQLKRSFEGPAWHGPSVLEALEGLTPEAAQAHPVPGAHSVWELVLHLAGTYVRSAVLRFDGDQLDRPLTAGAPYTAYTQFIGITQHDLYHAGQIAILRRAIAPE